MSKQVLIQAAKGTLHGSFRRLGRTFTTEGTVVDAGAFTKEEWDILVAEPMLHVGPAPEGAVAAAPDDSALREAVKTAIGNLAPDDFGDDGKPKLAAVRKQPGARGATADLLAEVWAQLHPAT